MYVPEFLFESLKGIKDGVVSIPSKFRKTPAAIKAIFTKEFAAQIVDIAATLSATGVAAKYEYKKSLPRAQQLFMRLMIEQQKRQQLGIADNDQIEIPEEMEEFTKLFESAAASIAGAWDIELWFKKLPAAGHAFFVGSLPAAYHAIHGKIWGSEPIEYGVPQTLAKSSYNLLDGDTSGASAESIITGKAESSDLKDFMPYKYGVLEACKIFVERSLHGVEERLEKYIGRKKVHAAEKRTFGLLSFRTMTLIIKEFIVPITLHAAHKQAQEYDGNDDWKKNIAEYFPNYNAFDLGMVRPIHNVQVTDEEGENGHTVAYEELDKKSFLKRSVIRAVIEVVARNSFIRALSGEFKLTDKMYYVGEKLGAIPIALRLTNTNVMQSLSKRFKRTRVNFLLKRPELLASLIETAKFSAQTEEDQKAISDCYELLYQAEALLYEAQSAEFSGNHDRVEEINKEVHERLKMIAEIAVENGYLGKTISLFMDQWVTGPYAPTRPLVEWTTGKVALKLFAKRLGAA